MYQASWRISRLNSILTTEYTQHYELNSTSSSEDVSNFSERLQFCAIKFYHSTYSEQILRSLEILKSCHIYWRPTLSKWVYLVWIDHWSQWKKKLTLKMMASWISVWVRGPTWQAISRIQIAHKKSKGNYSSSLNIDNRQKDISIVVSMSMKQASI